MITNSKHPIAQSLFERIRNDHVQQIESEHTIVETFICPSFEDAVYVQQTLEKTLVYRIDRKNFNVLSTHETGKDINDIITSMKKKATEKISAKLDGTVVFMRIASELTVYEYIEPEVVIEEVRAICNIIGIEYNWLTSESSL